MARSKNSINKKLAAYSAAAAAALTIAPAANAAIVYSGPQNLNVNSGSTVSVDLDGALGTDFVFFYTYGEGSGIFLSSDSVNGTGHVAEASHNDAARLPYGYTIGPGISGFYYWQGGSVYQTLNTYYNSLGIYSDGNFNFATGYIGVRFPAICPPTGGLGTAYGWIHYQGFSDYGTVIDWAYDDACVPIQAGAGGQVSTVPTMGEWGMLLLAGLLSAAAIKAVNREQETA